MFDFSAIPLEKVQDGMSSSYLLEKGRCQYVVKSAETYVSQNSGKTTMKVVFSMTDSKNKTLDVWNFMGMNTSLIKFLMGHGFEEEIKARKINPSKLVGLKGEAEITHDENQNGEPQNSVKFFVFRNKNTKDAHTTPIAPSSSAAASALMDDDVPF